MCGDAASAADVATLMADFAVSLAIQDPPYNFVAFERRPTEDFIDCCLKCEFFDTTADLDMIEVGRRLPDATVPGRRP